MIKISQRVGPQYAGYLFEAAPGKKTKKKRWFYVDGGVLYHAPDKENPPTKAYGLTNAKVNKKNGTTEFEIEFADKNEKPLTLEALDSFEAKTWIENLQTATEWRHDNYYGIFSLLGKGSFASVHGGYNKTTNEQVAIKILRKKEFKPKELHLLISEYKASKQLCHPNIMRVIDVFNTENTLTIIMELMGGGTLMSFADQQPNRRLKEKVVAEISYSIFAGLEYLHRIGVSHRDIKPENIMLKSRSSPFDPKIIDFGFCSWFNPEFIDVPYTNTLIGTPVFSAPEILEGKKYTCSIDLFAMGVSIYSLLYGALPFDGKTDGEVLKHMKKRTEKYSDLVSNTANSLIKSLLHTNPMTRLSATAAMQHPWFKDYQKDLSVQDKPVSKLKALLFSVVFLEKCRCVLFEQTEFFEEGTTANVTPSSRVSPAGAGFGPGDGKSKRFSLIRKGSVEPNKKGTPVTSTPVSVSSDGFDNRSKSSKLKLSSFTKGSFSKKSSAASPRPGIVSPK